MSIVPYQRNKGNIITPPSNDPGINIELPYVPKGTSKVIFEFSKLLLHDDMADIGKFTYIGHPSRTHHWIWGAMGIGVSTLAGLLEKANEMFDELAEEVDPNDQFAMMALEKTRMLKDFANNSVHLAEQLVGNPPPLVGELRYEQTRIKKPQYIPQRQGPIYMGKIPAKKTSLPSLPPPKKPIPGVPEFLVKKARK